MKRVSGFHAAAAVAPALARPRKRLTGCEFALAELLGRLFTRRVKRGQALYWTAKRDFYAADLGCTVTTISRAKTTLARQGYVKLTQRTKANGQHTSTLIAPTKRFWKRFLYRVTFPAHNLFSYEKKEQVKEATTRRQDSLSEKGALTQLTLRAMPRPNPPPDPASPQNLPSVPVLKTPPNSPTSRFVLVLMPFSPEGGLLLFFPFEVREK